MVKRKRAAGAGRKPKGPFSKLTSPLTIRMPAELRKELEDAAHRSGKVISQELMRRLADSFYRDREKARDPAMRALCFLVAETAHQVVGIHSGGEDSVPIANWREDPFYFKAFKIAVAKLLDELEPQGPTKPPAIRWHLRPTVKGDRSHTSALNLLKKSYETPQARGTYAAGYIWNALLTAQRSPVELEDERKRLEEMRSSSALREFYGMTDAVRDLKANYKRDRS